MKFIRTIRFDDSDLNIFDSTAAPDEWAVPGGFAFAQLSESDLVGKTRQAFANGFLGLSTFGRSTFATVSVVTQDELCAIEAALARHFVVRYGAPNIDAAFPVARNEVGFVVDLCADVPINTVFTLRRRFDEAGEIREEFRKIAAPGAQPMHTKIWSVVDDDS